MGLQGFLVWGGSSLGDARVSPQYLATVPRHQGNKEQYEDC
jgi:hypothetical protein